MRTWIPTIWADATFRDRTLFTPRHCLLQTGAPTWPRGQGPPLTADRSTNCPEEVTRLAQMTASCFYPSHLLCNTPHKHTASRPAQLRRTIALSSGSLFVYRQKQNSQRRHIKRSAEMSGVMGSISLIYWHRMKIMLGSDN